MLRFVKEGNTNDTEEKVKIEKCYKERRKDSTTIQRERNEGEKKCYEEGRL